MQFFVQIKKPRLIWGQWFPMLFGFRFLIIYLNFGIDFKLIFDDRLECRSPVIRYKVNIWWKNGEEGGHVPTSLIMDHFTTNCDALSPALPLMYRDNLLCGIVLV